MTPGAAFPDAKKPSACAMRRIHIRLKNYRPAIVGMAGREDYYFLWNVAPPSVPTDIVSFFAFRAASVPGAMS